MQEDLQKTALEWVTSAVPEKPDEEFYAETRDIFQARLDRMLAELLKLPWLPEDDAYILSAIAGEVGNNSFDHNLGNWPDMMGIFFGYAVGENTLQIVLADRGQGVFKTLSKVRPSIKNDGEALRTAFTEKLSGRAPEARGNGLKFVRENVMTQKMHLSFVSGAAKAELNQTMEITPADMPARGCFAVFDFEINKS